jgi:hypothetical protein
VNGAGACVNEHVVAIVVVMVKNKIFFFQVRSQ